MNEKETNKLRRRGSEKWETSVGGFSMGKKRLVVNVIVGEKGTCWPNKHDFEVTFYISLVHNFGYIIIINFYFKTEISKNKR